MTKYLAGDVGNIPVFEKMDVFRCCGCEACVNICPEKIITMASGEYGFRYPHMNKNMCTHCQKCVRTCPVLAPVGIRIELRETYAGYVLNEDLVKSSSSGGFFTVLAQKFLMQENAYVSAVVWANDFRSTYHICGGVEDIEKMKRSKYIQSRKNDIYQLIESKLLEGCHMMFVGCPCEVAGLKNYLGEEYEKLVCIDLVCQGPTSEKVMVEYVDMMERRYKSKITQLNLRFVGSSMWIPQWMKMEFANGKRYLKSYYRTPLGVAFHMMQRPSCYHCKFAGDNRWADLTLGDFHGADETKNYYNPNGTSIVIVNTVKGKRLINNIMNEPVLLESESYESVSLSNPRILGPWEPYEGSEMFWDNYRKFGLMPAVHKAFTLRGWLPFVIPLRLRTKLQKLKQSWKQT